MERLCGSPDAREPANNPSEAVLVFFRIPFGDETPPRRTRVVVPSEGSAASLFCSGREWHSEGDRTTGEKSRSRVLSGDSRAQAEGLKASVC